MHKVNRYHSDLLVEATSFGLDLNQLRKKYGLPFVIKLFKYIKKESAIGVKKINSIYPKKNFGVETSTYDYIEELKNAGFKLVIWVEDFIDEDTGKIVGIKRFKFKSF